MKLFKGEGFFDNNIKDMYYYHPNNKLDQEQKKTAYYLKTERNWSFRSIAKVLGVSDKTAARAVRTYELELKV